MFLAVLLTAQLQAQVSTVVYGKNRIQHHDDFDYRWSYESQNFIVHWYGKARKIAESVVKIAEYEYPEIQGILEHRINDKIEILVYTDVTDLKQSNIGTTETFITQAGKTKIAGNKVFVYFNGDHKDLRRQIRQGIARVYLQQMLYGGNIQEFVQNAITNDLPQWYIDGLVSFIGQPWSVEVDNDMRELVATSDFRDFLDFANADPRLAGHSLWFYISSKYGNTALSNLLYITRFNRRLESGFLYVLGEQYEVVLEKSFDYFMGMFESQLNIFSNPIEADIPVRYKKREQRATEIKLSHNGEFLVYIVNEIGKYHIYLKNLQTGDRELLMKKGFRNPFQETDYQYPLVTWRPDGQMLSIIYEHRDVMYLREISLKDGTYREQDVAPNFQRVYDFEYLDNDHFVFAASADGYADIFIYRPQSRSNDRLTQDFYDDASITVGTYQGQKGIFFTSNRQRAEKYRERIDTILPVLDYDIYFMPAADNFEDSPISMVTNTPQVNEREPVYQPDENAIYYLGDKNGIWNVYKYSLDPDGESGPLTNSSMNINTFDVKSDLLVHTTQFDRRPHIRANYDPGILNQQLPKTAFALGQLSQEEQKIYVLQETQNETVPEEDRPDFKFQSRFPDELKVRFPDDERDGPSADDLSLSMPNLRAGKFDPDRKIVEFRNSRALAYRLRFSFDEITTTLDNSPLFTGLDSYAGFKQGFDFPPMGILIKSTIKDVYEDYRIQFGTRISTNFNGAEYFVVFDNLKAQWDKRIAFYRRGERIRNDPRFADNIDNTRNSIHLMMLEFKYPFDIYNSIRLSTTIRQDRVVFLASEQASLAEPDFVQQRIGVRAEYVFDNTYDVALNIKNGTRAKAYIEGVNRFQLQFNPWNFEASESFMTVVGFDARHYERLLRHSVFALRMAGETSFGSERILYYMGGVDNWLDPSYNNTIPFPNSESFAFQGAALNMRGFDQNIRNGSSYVVMNAEVRLPIFKYFTRKQIKSSFFRNFQLVGFYDVGTAWHGNSPYDSDNPLNSQTIQNPVSTLRVEYFRDPLVMGYGGGVRLQLFGYFIRLDYGWGVETRVVQDPKFYIAMGYDF